MGHIRLGRLPKLRPWTGVFSVLESQDLNAAALAQATATAAQEQFAGLERNEAINYCFWILVRIVTASRGDAFVPELERFGIKTESSSSGLAFVQQVSQAIELEFKRRNQIDVFAQMASLSLREVLTGNIAERAKSLFGTSIKDVQAACRAFSSPKNFALLAKQFYATFTNRSLSFITDKELSNYVGPGKSLSNPTQALEFHKALDRYCFESAKIVEDFAAGWLSKNNWQTNQDISEDLAHGFTTYALQKIQMELREGRK
jgi:hypothetical protein